MNVKKGDIVKVMVGKDGGKTGKVMRVEPSSGRVIVDGLNRFKKHVRPKKQGEKGEVVEVSRPIDSSNVLVVCSSCSKPTRVGYQGTGREKIRVCKRCHAPL